MGLVYNRKLFTQAGLDPDSPPKTWAEVQEAAKKIAALGAGYVGFGEYSAGNTGGWHFTASLYAPGGVDGQRRRQDRRVQQPRGQGGAGEPQADALGRQHAWAASSSSSGRT